MKTIRLREGKERSLQRQHPWVFQGSVEKGRADAGEKQVARQMFERSLDTRRSLKDEAGVAENLRDLAQLADHRVDPSRTRRRHASHTYVHAIRLNPS